ncbi:SixA phosphatase family protein [Sphingomicrobium clamense]|uniref:Histidine phosphatase family protein n=1 Tax=Sphingomicrobium clamense TaxID=2851013 RepID=A0ABS6V8D6_9SPHN|nr:histidine phosphatase family protein [Sphingomicrobium sp. B8]MBW0145851.1 histidine phosphatase family protein [Sphingomicrobium sp. B8]
MRRWSDWRKRGADAIPDLLLLRHAKSDWHADYGRDFDRPLNARGRKAAEAMGKFLAKQPAIDRVLASPARRVAETLDRVGAHCDLPEIEWVESLYGASQGTVVDLARRCLVERLLVAGHNPVTHMVAATLTRPDGSEDWHMLQRKYPTGALVELRFMSWDDIGAGNGELLRFVRPRDL